MNAICCATLEEFMKAVMFHHIGDIRIEDVDDRCCA